MLQKVGRSPSCYSFFHNSPSDAFSLISVPALHLLGPQVPALGWWLFPGKATRALGPLGLCAPRPCQPCAFAPGSWLTPCGSGEGTAPLQGWSLAPGSLLFFQLAGFRILVVLETADLTTNEGSVHSGWEALCPLVRSLKPQTIGASCEGECASQKVLLTP